MGAVEERAALERLSAAWRKLTTVAKPPTPPPPAPPALPPAQTPS
jgi:hypothetical protein